RSCASAAPMARRTCGRWPHGSSGGRRRSAGSRSTSGGSTRSPPPASPRAPPVLRAAPRPLAADPEREQSVLVVLNERPVAELRIDRETPISAILPPPYFRAAFNVVELQYRYRRPPSALDESHRIGKTGVRSAGDLRITSAGQPYGEAASIEFNG